MSIPDLKNNAEQKMQQSVESFKHALTKIRTGGEMRISNFLLWQAAYSELHFSDKLWPDFDDAALDDAIAVYRSRERRFGQTSAQIGGGKTLTMKAA